MNTKMNDYSVVIGIDFGTTYSGFAYAHKKDPYHIYTKEDWQDYYGRFKVPTVLLYDNEYKEVQSWGFAALAKKPSNRRRKPEIKEPVELFKLHLGKMKDGPKPTLPKEIDYKKAITDYLRKMGDIIKDTIDSHWKVNFYTQVLIILTIPAEFDNTAVSIMRECAFNAGLLNDQYSQHLRFIAKPEAAAIHCMETLKEYNLSVGSNFMVVTCGGGTVDLTSRKLLEDDRLSEITERTGDFCGGSFVDQEFLKFLERKVGTTAISLVKKKCYSQLQYTIREFYRMVKVKFTGVKSDFQPTELELDLDELCPALMQHCNGDYRINMEEDEWIVVLKFEDVKAMFDPVVERIIQLVDAQLHSNSDCSALFLVGGFSESRYLQSRIKQTFNTRIPHIIIPIKPVTAVIKGAVKYGLDEEVVATRVLKLTYGTDLDRKWRPGDPEDRRRSNGRIVAFERLAKRGTQLSAGHKINWAFSASNAQQLRMGLDLYVTPEYDAKFCDESHVKLLGKWSIELPRSTSEEDRSVLFTMDLTDVEIKVTAVNCGSNELFKGSFDQPLQLKENEIRESSSNYVQSQIRGQSKKIKTKLQKRQNFDQLQKSSKLKENRIREINQQYISKIKLQKQNVDQLQQSLESKENQIKEIEKQHLSSVQQLEGQISNTSQYQSKTTLQEQSIDQLQQSLQPKDDEIQNSNNSFNRVEEQHLSRIQQLESQISDYQNKITLQGQNIDQLQRSLESKENQIKEIEKQHLSSVQQLEGQISNISQQYQNKITLQEQSIDQLQQSLQLKDDEIQNSNNSFNRVEEQHLSRIQQLESQISDYQNKITLQGQNIDQLQRSLESKENQIKEIEKQHLSSVQQLEGQISNISQQYQNKITLQEQSIDQLQQSLQLKDDEIQNSNNSFNRVEEQHLSRIQQLGSQISDYQNKITLQGQNIDQLQQSLESKENQIKEIEKQHLSSIQQLEDQIINVSQQYQSKIKLQKQNIDQLQRSLNSKENEVQESNNDSNQYKLLCNKLQEDISNINQKHQDKIMLQKQKIDQLQQLIQNLEKEKEESNAENNLHQKITNLENKLENLSQRNVLLEDEGSNYRLEDSDQIYVTRLINNIVELNNNFKKYITDLKQDVIVNIEEVEKLLLLYKCPTKITDQNNDQLLIQAVLQRHIMETIFSYATEYFQSTGQHDCYHLESNIVNKAYSLSTLLTNTSKYRSGNEEVTRSALTKLRQQIYLILNDCGFTDVFGEDNSTYEHPFIVYHKEQLNEIINELRTIKDNQKRMASENLAATIIREIIKMFWFRFKIQESVVQYVWIPYDTQVDKTFMEGNGLDDGANLYVDLCYFPLIGRELKSDNRKVYTPAKVFTSRQMQEY